MIERFSRILQLIGLCFMLIGCFLITQVPDGYQVVLPAGNLAQTYPVAVSVVDSLDELVNTATVSARQQNVWVQDEIELTLYAIDAYYPEICHETLKIGRLISNADVLNQRHVIVIDEWTAYTLYTGGDVIGRTVHLKDIDWTIVGVMADKVRVGEADKSVAYVPISTMAEQQVDMDTLEIRVISNEHVALIQSVCLQWYTDAGFYDLFREKYAALMPLHWIETVICLLITAVLFKRTLYFSRKQYYMCRSMLYTHYARELKTWLAGRLLIILLLLIIVSVFGVFTLKLITAPALVFTDWIPESPVSITSYINRFWLVHQQGSKTIDYNTREKSMIELASWMIRWGTFMTLGGTIINRRENNG